MPASGWAENPYCAGGGWEVAMGANGSMEGAAVVVVPAAKLNKSLAAVEVGTGSLEEKSSKSSVACRCCMGAVVERKSAFPAVTVP